MKRVEKYFDDEELHVIVFNDDGSIFEHWTKKNPTLEDIKRSEINVSEKKEVPGPW